MGGQSPERSVNIEPRKTACIWIGIFSKHERTHCSMKLLIIRPVISEREDALEEAIVQPFLSPGTKVVARRIRYGASSIESEYDAAVNVPEIIRLAVEGEQEGFDGAAISCFADPGLDAAREAVSYPIVGAGMAAVQMALSVGRRIAIVTIVPAILPMIRRLNAEYLTTGRVCAVRSVDVPVLSIYGDDLIYDKLFEESAAAVAEDGADAIVLGCTGLGGMAEKVEKRLAQSGIPVPVVDPAGASVALLEALVRCNLRHSKIGWMPPAQKERRFKE